MTTMAEAIYEDGKLGLPTPLPPPDKSHVQVTIESPPSARLASSADDLLNWERRNRVWRELDDAEGW